MYLLHKKTAPENKRKTDRKSAMERFDLVREEWMRKREIFFSLDGSMLVEKKISWVCFCVCLSLCPLLVAQQDFHSRTEVLHYSTRCHENTCPSSNS